LPKSEIELYTRYPIANILIYNGTTVLHFLLGGTGIILGYGSWIGVLAGIVYMVLALLEMYVLMPLKVCPNCVYTKLENSLCIAGMNVVSRKIAKPGDIKLMGNRAKGTFCPNNLYVASLVIPIIAMIPALIFNFSWAVLAIFLVVVGLMIFRFFFIFTKIACVHCRAKHICPQAQQMFKDLKPAKEDTQTK